MARISYDEPTAAAFSHTRDLDRDGLGDWREAIRAHLRPVAGTSVVDIGAGTGVFAVALAEWFDVRVAAVEPSPAMRARIPRTPGIDVLEGDACSLPLPDASAHGAWLSLSLHHIADLEAAAREIRRVVRPGAPVLIRNGFRDCSHDRIENVRWFPETTRTLDTYPSVEQTCAAFAAAGFHREALERVRETYPASLADLLADLDTLRQADTTLGALTEEEFHRGKERVRRAVLAAEHAARPEVRSNWLDLLVLR